ncbi:MAG TPA: hypothetical protein VNS09_00860 [Solirubrobacter sp.]|nr:hypothetical protein [Solirubrobacter sp.]
MARLRCVFYDPDAVAAESRLSERALEACARAEVAVFALTEDAVEFEGEARGIGFVMRALALAPEQCIGVGAALAAAPVGTIWVSPLDLEIRGPNVRVAEDGGELLYEAVISELAQRR